MSTVNYFGQLAGIDMSEAASSKNNLTYIAWASAWAALKMNYPNAYYTVYENDEGLNYHHDGRTAWVKVGVTLPDLNMGGGLWNGEHIEYLPVMNYRNQPILVEDANFTSFAVNNSIQRAVTKAIARHGIGISVYINGDPDGLDTAEPQTEPPVAAPVGEAAPTLSQMREQINAILRSNPELRTTVNEIKAVHGVADRPASKLPANVLVAILAALTQSAE